MEDRKLLLTEYKGAKAAFYLEDEALMMAELEDKESRSRIGEIYVGKIKSIADGIGAAFVEYEKGTVGFLPLEEIRPEMLLNKKGNNTVSCEDELLVQVYKDPMKHKDATLTTDLLFSGKYIILTPFSPGIRFSRKLKKEDKTALLDRIDRILEELFTEREVFLSRYGCIVRTNAAAATSNELFYEFHELFHTASKVLQKASGRTAFSLLYQDAPFYQRILRDQYDLSTLEVITDDPKIKDLLSPKTEFELDEETMAGLSHLDEEQRKRFLELMESVSKQFASHRSEEQRESCQIRLWEDPEYSLLLRYKIPSALDQAVQKKVWMRSGGFLIIEPTEALTVIDVNSGKAASKKKVPEDFILKINLEAAAEIARALRLRNLSGIIIVDFINMEQEESRQTLLHALKRELLKDPVGSNLIDMTKLGLVEITRRKTKAPLKERLAQIL